MRFFLNNIFKDIIKRQAALLRRATASYNIEDDMPLRTNRRLKPLSVWKTFEGKIDFLLAFIIKADRPFAFLVRR